MSDGVKLGALGSHRSPATFADIGGHRHHQKYESTLLSRLGKKQTLKLKNCLLTHHLSTPYIYLLTTR